MDFLKFILGAIDVIWYVIIIVVTPFAIAWIFYLCPIVIAFFMFAWILWGIGKTRLAYQIWRSSNCRDRDMLDIARGNSAKTLLIVIVCMLSIWWAVWATIRFGDAAGDKLCNHPQDMMWFTMPSIVLHFYTPRCGPPQPSWLDREPSDVIFGGYPK